VSPKEELLSAFYVNLSWKALTAINLLIDYVWNGTFVGNIEGLSLQCAARRSETASVHSVLESGALPTEDIVTVLAIPSARNIQSVD